MEPIPIPTPQLRDPDYAQQLWHDLDAMRAYLLNSLPPDPRSPGPHLTSSTAPTGPEDDTGWSNWISAYATVTSILCGPHGDSGFGLEEAQREATVRRSAPVPPTATGHPDLGAASTPPEEQPKDGDTAPTSPGRPRFRAGRAAATGVLVLLALRGLRRPSPRS